jgi:hypothetical protein
MTGDEVHQVCAAMRPQEARDRLGAPCDVIARERQLPLGRCVRALVSSAGTPGGASQAEGRRSSLACDVPRVARSACDRGFDAPLARCLAAWAARALADARAPPRALTGLRGGVTDGAIVDVTTVRVRAALPAEVPGPGASAALKGPQGRAVGGGAPVRSHGRPARAHDRRPRHRDASWRGYGRLADLASARLERLRACAAPGGRCVIRRPETGQPTVDARARGQVTPAFGPETARDVRRDEASLRRAGRVLDAAGQVGRGAHAWPRRLVGVQPPHGGRLLPDDAAPAERPAAGGGPRPGTRGGGTQPPARYGGPPPGGDGRRATVLRDDPRARLAPRLDPRRPPRPYPPWAHPAAAGGSATPGGSPAPSAPGLATGRLLSGQGPGL